jgi:HAD superfamily hydrolase (TIGR01509 family)
MRYAAILFDFDGVLADSENLHAEAFRRVLALRKQPLTRQDYFARYIHFDDLNVFRTLSADRGLGWNEDTARELSAQKVRLYKDLLRDGDILYPAAAPLVRELADKLPLAVCSMSAREEVEPVLVRAGLRDCFAAMVTAEDVQQSKPDPQPYLLTLARLNQAGARGGRAPVAPARCLVVEDTPGGTRAGKAAGMQVAALTHTLGETELRKAGADFVFDGLPALGRFVLKTGSGV